MMKISTLFIPLVAILFITNTVQWGNDEDENLDEASADVVASVNQRVYFTCSNGGSKIISVKWKNSDGFSLADMKDNKTNIPRSDKYELEVTDKNSTLIIKKVDIKSQGCYTCEITGDNGAETSCKKCLYVNTHVLYVWGGTESSSMLTCFVGSKDRKAPSWRVRGIVTTGSLPYGLPVGYNRGVDGYSYSMITINNVTDAVRIPYCRYWLNHTHAREYPVDFSKHPQGIENELTNFKVVYGRW
ncbi:SWPV1-024 [Shearwaterpox virus]|uniref:SWPV1-024 n=1 Tax=Shearwaterpox virus TaxID=1974596 RepID=A0A1V0S7P3_CNPV|nr:SWPV1-024 [Shearwaterpox virus]